MLEAVLQETPYLVGSNMTLADLSVITGASSVDELLPLSDDKYPKVKAWIKRMEALPYYEKLNTQGTKVLQQLYRDALAKNKADAGK